MPDIAVSAAASAIVRADRGNYLPFHAAQDFCGNCINQCTQLLLQLLPSGWLGGRYAWLVCYLSQAAEWEYLLRSARRDCLHAAKLEL